MVQPDIIASHKAATASSQETLAYWERCEAESAAILAADREHGAPSLLIDHWTLRFARECAAALRPLMRALSIPDKPTAPAPKPSATVIEFPS